LVGFSDDAALPRSVGVPIFVVGGVEEEFGRLGVNAPPPPPPPVLTVAVEMGVFDAEVMTPPPVMGVNPV